MKEIQNKLQKLLTNFKSQILKSINSIEIKIRKMKVGLSLLRRFNGIQNYSKTSNFNIDKGKIKKICDFLNKCNQVKINEEIPVINIKENIFERNLQKMISHNFSYETFIQTIDLNSDLYLNSLLSSIRKKSEKGFQEIENKKVYSLSFTMENTIISDFVRIILYYHRKVVAIKDETISHKNKYQNGIKYQFKRFSLVEIFKKMINVFK